MNVPLSWLSDYVELPETDELTRGLTLIGHMLDKTIETPDGKVVDLELRGNRSDLFGLVGIARDISAYWKRDLKLPQTGELPAIDASSQLVTVEAAGLVERFTAFTMDVRVGPSPDWMVRRLEAYGLPSINNVVDITNYAMIETGLPLHAFDLDKLDGNRLVVRMANPGEPFTTLLGTDILLTEQDLVLADARHAQSTTPVGGKATGVTGQTTRILLESAVYNQASVRHTARRHGIRTEAGNRLEKHQDPNQVAWALSRAAKLLTDLAAATPTSALSDFYPHIRKPVSLTYPVSETKRLSGVDVDADEAVAILTGLGCTAAPMGSMIVVTVPTFRTDVTQNADVTEEIIRIHGYDTIQPRLLAGAAPLPETSPVFTFAERVRDVLTGYQVNEIITSSLLANDDPVPMGSIQPVMLTNAPDPSASTMRPSLIPNLVHAVARSVKAGSKRQSFFEIGRVFVMENDAPAERTTVGIAVAGSAGAPAWNVLQRQTDLFDLKGIVEGLMRDLGIEATYAASDAIPYAVQGTSGTVRVNDGTVLGTYATLNPETGRACGIPGPVFVAELDLTALMGAPKTDANPYVLPAPYPPVIEDLSFSLPIGTRAGALLSMLESTDPLVSGVRLTGTYGNTLTFRVTYASPERTLTAGEVKPVRDCMIERAASEFKAILKTK